MTIEKRLERVEAILDARGLDWDHPRVEDDHSADASKMVADEPKKEASLDGLPDIRTFAQPNLRWRILGPGEVVCSSDWICARSNLPSDPPNGFGWRPVDASVGTTVYKDEGCIFARPVTDEPAKEAKPEHPAGPMPSMESYRPVDDGDVGKIVEVQNYSADPWRECTLLAIDWDRPYGFLCRHSDPVIAHRWRFARIKIEEPANKKPADEPRKKWRILEPGEVVQDGDLKNAKANPPSDPPDGLGWIPVIASVGASVCEDDLFIFARLVADEPAKEAKPEHPAGPMPSMESYRPVDDGDVGKIVEVQNYSADPWRECTLLAIDWDRPYGFLCRHSDPVIAHRWRFARIKIEEPANKKPADEPRKKWRILEPGEVVQDGDLVNAKINPPSDPPDGLGWIPVIASVGASVCEDDLFIFARLVADEPAKNPEHQAGQMPDPGEGYRILSKNPLEDLQEGDEFWFQAKWYRSAWSNAYIKDQEKNLWYRRKIGFLAKEPEPAWEPKVGDWVRVTRPENWIEWRHPRWGGAMHVFEGRVGQIERESKGHFHICGLVAWNGFKYQFHRDWLSPAEPPAKEKPAEPEYREPVLPADYKMACEFSDNGSSWASGRLGGWSIRSGWISTGSVCWRYCRIKKDA